jgi:hypothetical protein
LPGVRQVRLEPLGLDCAIYLLACLAGFARVRAESGAARAIADACSRRPLALRIAGEWLLARPGRPLADLVALLADRDVLLDRLTVADLSMRASIAAHVAQLRPDERLLLRDLADLDTDRLTPADLCHRLATSEPDLREGLAQLAHANLLTQVGSWYRMDPLVRRYAIEDAGHPRLRAAR